MKKQESKLFNRPLKGEEKNLSSNSPDWTKVLFEVIIKILTLGFYHIEKHRK